MIFHLQYLINKVPSPGERLLDSLDRQDYKIVDVPSDHWASGYLENKTKQYTLGNGDTTREAGQTKA